MVVVMAEPLATVVTVPADAPDRILAGVADLGAVAEITSQEDSARAVRRFAVVPNDGGVPTGSAVAYPRVSLDPWWAGLVWSLPPVRVPRGPVRYRIYTEGPTGQHTVRRMGLVPVGAGQEDNGTGPHRTGTSVSVDQL